MTIRTWRALMGLSLAVAFWAAGFSIVEEPNIGTIVYLQRFGFTPLFIAWAFIISAVANAYMGLKGYALNPAAFAIFILYTFFTWQAAQIDPDIPRQPAVFYTLVCVMYVLFQYADRKEEVMYGSDT